MEYFSSEMLLQCLRAFVVPSPSSPSVNLSSQCAFLSPLKGGSRCWHPHDSSPSQGTELRSVIQPVRRGMMHPLGKGS